MDATVASGVGVLGGAATTIEEVPVGSVTPDPANVRVHPEWNIEAIRASLQRFGQQRPILVSPRGVVIAGNGTLAAAKSLGWATVKVQRTSLDGAEATAYAIADNRTAELAEWDDEALAKQLSALEIDDEALARATGYDEKELRRLVDSMTETVEDEVPPVPVDPVTKPGDLWLLGDHRLLCGDSMKAEDVARVMGGEQASLCFTSPPYGQQREYTPESNCSDWDALMCGVFSHLPMVDDGQVLVNLGLIHRENELVSYWDSWVSWMRSRGWRRFSLYVWDKTYAIMGDHHGRYASAYEFVFHFNKRSVTPQKWVETLGIDRDRTNGGGQRAADGTVKRLASPEKCGQDFKIPDNVIRLAPNCNNHDGSRTEHPATFPTTLPTHFMKSWDGLCYEPFMGSGTSIVAAEQLKRRCYGIEISPAYCDVAVRRWEKLTGRTATLAPR